MSESRLTFQKAMLENAVSWFRTDFRQKLVSPIEGQFPNYPLPAQIQAIMHGLDEIPQWIQGQEGDIPVQWVAEELSKGGPDRAQLFKQVVLIYRRWRAAETERYSERTFHLELTGTVQQEIKALDALVNEEWFQRIEALALPRLKDFLPVQFIESALVNQVPLLPRQYDEKFHILQAPNLFLPDLAYFRAKCDIRNTLLAVAFLDIDDFKSFNSDHGDTKVDRNLLPRFMQAIEAHIFHHGYAYRQGGDEYLILVPSLSRPMAIAFLEELRSKLAKLQYPEILTRTTVSIGLCVVEADCSLTDRELRDRASQAKQFAKEHGKNCIATFRGPRFTADELTVVSPSERTGPATAQPP